MLYYDQLNVIARHLQDSPGIIKAITTPLSPPLPTSCRDPSMDTPSAKPSGNPSATSSSQDPTQYLADDPWITREDLGKFFTLRQLKKWGDWEQWRKARFKMLDSYEGQGMFSSPMEPPAQANIHHMLWRYTIKCVVLERPACSAMAPLDKVPSLWDTHSPTV